MKKRTNRMLALMIAALLAFGPCAGMAESGAASLSLVPMSGAETEELPESTEAEGAEAANAEAENAGAEDVEAEDVEVEGVAVEENAVAADDTGVADITGMKPLYSTTIKPYVASGTAIRMRARQDGESEVVCTINAREPITVYAVYPSYVLAEYEGNVGYIIRTWVNEEMVTLDPQNTPPYGVTLCRYVGRLTDFAPVYDIPSTSGKPNKIVAGKGSRVAIIDFEEGFAKVLIWRSYGYIDARLITDLTVVSRTDDQMSPDSPIAAFCSFFEYNTGKEGNEGRCKNIVRSCELMTRVMQPGESLDFNAQIGPYKRTNGYFPAPVLIDGGSKLGYGGGTCQSSSTLYNTIRQLPGVTVLKRRPHGPGCAKYLPMHQDAAVGNNQLNLIIRNDYDFPISILAESTGEGVLCIQVFRGD